MPVLLTYTDTRDGYEECQCICTTRLIGLSIASCKHVYVWEDFVFTHGLQSQIITLTNLTVLKNTMQKTV